MRGGEHNVGGRAVWDGGLMIDLSLMKGVHINARYCIAVSEGGAPWKDLNRETRLHCLAVTGGVVGRTGVAGLTLGGGLGWLVPKHGLALDNLIAVIDSTLVPFRGFTLLLALFLNAHPPSDRKGAPPAPETRSASLRSSGFVGGFVGGPERSGARRGAEDFRTRVSPPVR